MKKILLLASMLFFCLISFGQQVKISVKFENEPIKSILNEIEKKTEYTFVYSTTLIDTQKRLTLEAIDEKLESLLNKLCSQAGLSYTVEGKRIILTKKGSAKETKNIKIIKGKVFDNEKKPLIGAYVYLKDNLNCCGMTDLEGDFTISVDENSASGDSLVVKYIGMKNIIVPFDSSKEFLFVLEQDVRYLEDVVVTGYQTLSRERSSGSFSIVKSASLENKTASMNVVDRLEGLVPGLSINMSEGSDKLLMRGLTSLNASRSPLVVIDGIPSSYESVSNLVNPNDVESITFLKDATAASIWGAAAANGVINIVTKIGKSEVRRPKVSYNSFVSIKGRPDYSYQKLMNSEQLITAAKESFSSTDYPWSQVTASSGGQDPVVYPHEKILYDLERGLINQQTANGRLDSLARLNNRAQIDDFLTQNAILTNHNITFTGGSSFHNYYASYGYTSDNKSDKSESNKHQINLRQIFHFTPHIKLDLTSNIAYEKSSQFLVPGLPATINSYLPYAMFQDEAGNALSQAYLKRYEPYRKDAEQKGNLDLDYIPLNENRYTQNGTTNLNARVSAGLDITLAPWLQYQGKFQYQKGYRKGYNYYDSRSYTVRDELPYYTVAAQPGGVPTYYLPMTGGHYQNISSVNSAWTVRNQLSLDKTFGDRHQLTAIAGTEVRADLFENHTNYRRGFDMQSQTYSPYDEKFLSTTGVDGAILKLGSFGNNTLSANIDRFSEVETRFFSLYSNVAYTLDRKYTFNGSIRMDQSNLFGSNKSTQFKPIWSAGLSWNISKEEFCNNTIFNNLVFRATFGYGGNSPRPGSGGPYDILYPSINSNFKEIGYIAAVPANKSLSWERTATTNIGVDFSILHNRLSGTIDIYSKRTEDLLGFYPVDPTGGWYYAYGNLGSISNDGFELSLSSFNIETKDFSWNTIFTLSNNKNKLTRLERNVPLTYSTKLHEAYFEGYPAYSLFGFNYKGLNSEGNPVAINSNGQEVTLSNELTADDPIFGGVTQPKWFGGLTNEFKYKDFSLSALVIYNFGYHMRRDVNSTYSERITENLQQSFANRWKKPGDENITDIPKYVPLRSSSDMEREIFIYTKALSNIVNASYVKLREITLSYTIPTKVSNKILMDNLVVYGQVNNLLLWTKNRDGIDPEFYDIRRGVRTTKEPAYLTLGIKVSFL